MKKVRSMLDHAHFFFDEGMDKILAIKFYLKIPKWEIWIVDDNFFFGPGKIIDYPIKIMKIFMT